MNDVHPGEHVLALTPDELAARLCAAGEACDLRQARSLLARLRGHRPGAGPKRETTPRRLREAVAAMAEAGRPAVVDVVEDPADGFVKLLFRAADGALFEAVRIPLERGRFTVCLSSQVGCGMGCLFCATGRLGLTRNLTAGEIVSSFLTVRDAAPGPVTGAVFMGQGEPFHNYDAVLRAARVLSDPTGARIAAEAITISTVGLVPEIHRYAREGHAFRLIVSLTSAIDARRRELLPIARKHDLPALAGALRAVQAARGGRVTVAWVTMAGVNCGDDEVEALRALLGDVPLIINLLDVNDARPDGFRPPDAIELGRFRDRLAALGVPIVRRYSGGKARHAACGMLARTRLGADPAPPE